MRQSDPPVLPIIAGSRPEQLLENVSSTGHQARPQPDGSFGYRGQIRTSASLAAVAHGQGPQFRK